MSRFILKSAAQSHAAIMVGAALTLPVVTFILLPGLILASVIVQIPFKYPSLTFLSLSGYWAVPAMWRALFSALNRTPAPLWVSLGIAMGIGNVINIYLNFPGMSHPVFPVCALVSLHWLWVSADASRSHGPNNSSKPTPLRGAA